MADGKISPEEAQQLRSALFADGQLTPDELEVVRKTMRETLGDNPLAFD
jgi:tellurite resistance protein